MNRRKSRVVFVGPLGVGGENPIRIQSMTTSSTADVCATVEQIRRLTQEGCEMVRVTVQGIKEARACELIKNRLLQCGENIPLIADIHFFPPAALRAAEFVDKVRINPGNYADRRASFIEKEYDEISYSRELEKIEEKFSPLVEKCKRLKRAMRIGTNHGSLSDRIMNRYGDTPAGMVESALEFARICRKQDYHEFFFSMKSSNPQVMIRAYRLLVEEMTKMGWDYPLHLGVTEAGEGEEGRIKSAIGIGSLLLDGLGDTIRVSLTEDAWKEIDPCRRLIALAELKGCFQEAHQPIFQRSRFKNPSSLSFHPEGSVVMGIDSEKILPTLFKDLGYATTNENIEKTSTSVDGLVLSRIPSGFSDLLDREISLFCSQDKAAGIALCSLEEAKNYKGSFAVLVRDEPAEELSPLKSFSPVAIFLAPTKRRIQKIRQFFSWFKKENLALPVILSFAYTESKEDLIIHAAAEFGSLLCDGMGDGIWIKAPYDLDFLRKLSFQILQGARLRMSKTDFISCPSCGRTLFNLQEVSAQIRKRTSHLPGLKIAIMGCIVNGPGEMADADVGYVGSKPGMIDLYVGKTCVEKNIPFSMAEERLVDLIKQQGRWVEPS